MTRKTLAIAALVLATSIGAGGAKASTPALSMAVFSADEQTPLAQTVQWYQFQYQYTPWGFNYQYRYGW